jgi:hypothetical protein
MAKAEEVKEGPVEKSQETNRNVDVYVDRVVKSMEEGEEKEPPKLQLCESLG